MIVGVIDGHGVCVGVWVWVALGVAVSVSVGVVDGVKVQVDIAVGMGGGVGLEVCSGSTIPADSVDRRLATCCQLGRPAITMLRVTATTHSRTVAAINVMVSRGDVLPERSGSVGWFIGATMPDVFSDPSRQLSIYPSIVWPGSFSSYPKMSADATHPERISG